MSVPLGTSAGHASASARASANSTGRLASRDRQCRVAHGMAEGVDNQRLRPQQRFDIFEKEKPLVGPRNNARRGRGQDLRCALDLSRQRGDIGVARGPICSVQRRARRFRLQPPYGDPGNDQLVIGPQRRWQGRGVDFGKRLLGLVEAADQKQAPDGEGPGMRGIDAIAVGFERRPRLVERLRRPAEVARDQRDLGLGDDAACARHSLPRTESARCPSQKDLGPVEIAELRHRDAAKGKGRRVVTQGDPLQDTEEITRCEGARGGRDQGVHCRRLTMQNQAVSRAESRHGVRVFADERPSSWP